MKLIGTAIVCAVIPSALSLAACGDVGSTRNGEALGSESQNLASDHSPAADSDIPATASVNTKSSLGVLSPIAVGANVAAWDSNLVDRGVSGLLEDAGIHLMRYPGGSVS